MKWFDLKAGDKVKLSKQFLERHSDLSWVRDLWSKTFTIRNLTFNKQGYLEFHIADSPYIGIINEEGVWPGLEDYPFIEIVELVEDD